MARLAPLLIAQLLLTTACASELPEDEVVHMNPRPNRGAVCALSSTALDWTQAQSFEVGSPIHFRFSVGECLSSSCNRDRSASCSAVLEGNVIEVQTHAEWSQPGPDEIACTLDCAELSATCATPPLAAGTYTVRAENLSFTVTVPSEASSATCNVAPQ